MLGSRIWWENKKRQLKGSNDSKYLNSLNFFIFFHFPYQILKLFLDPRFSARNKNKKIKLSNRSRSLDRLTFLFHFSFSSPNILSKHSLGLLPNGRSTNPMKDLKHVILFHPVVGIHPYSTATKLTSAPIFIVLDLWKKKRRKRKYSEISKFFKEKRIKWTKFYEEKLRLQTSLMVSLATSITIKWAIGKSIGPPIGKCVLKIRKSLYNKTNVKKKKRKKKRTKRVQKFEQFY